MTILRNRLKQISRWALLARKAAFQQWKYRSEHEGAACHTFVAGAQRSGTNMVMDVLERSYETTVYHERDRRAFENYLMREPEVIQALAKQNRAPCFAIKALCESQELTKLMEQFPPAKSLWVFRHYADVVNSMLQSWPEHAAHVFRMAENRNAAGWRGRGMSDETHAIIRRFGQRDLSHATAAALLWYLRNVLFFDQRLDEDPRAMLVDYESLVSRPADEFARVFGFLGLSYSSELVADVTPASVNKRPAPEVDSAVAALCHDLHRRLRTAFESRVQAQVG